jgi:hypothetical protein
VRKVDRVGHIDQHLVVEVTVTGELQGGDRAGARRGIDQDRAVCCGIREGAQPGPPGDADLGQPLAGRRLGRVARPERHHVAQLHQARRDRATHDAGAENAHVHANKSDTRHGAKASGPVATATFVG